jgi:hypothetical protein
VGLSFDIPLDRANANAESSRQPRTQPRRPIGIDPETPPELLKAEQASKKKNRGLSALEIQRPTFSGSVKYARFYVS